VVTALVLCQILPEVFVHDDTELNPVITGFAPVPYEASTIGDPDEPDLPIISLP
jgi:hypothetical protein